MGYYQHDLLWKVRHYVQRWGLLPRGAAVVVGVSGGPDSLCLLHVLLALAPEYELAVYAAHLNHQLRGAEADQDARYVASLAAEWGVACRLEVCDVAAYARRERLAIEEAARQCRYGFLAQVALEVGAPVIAVGHNADDQAESVLMHFIRGSGLAGLRGMLPLTPLSDYRFPLSTFHFPLSTLCLIRPLLETPRADIEAYCQQHDLRPRFDRSNLDTTYFRNWLRHTLLPLIETHNPGVKAVLCRSASLLAADYELLHSLTQEAWTRVARAESDESITLDLAAWRALPLSLRRSTLREAVHRLRRTLRNINFVHVEDAVQLAARGQAGEQATLPANLMLTVGYDTLLVAGLGCGLPWPERPWLEPGRVLDVQVPGQTPLPGSGWRLEVVLGTPDDAPGQGWDSLEGAWEVYLDADVLGSPLQLRTRRPGDRFAPLGMDGHTKALRDVFIHAKVPREWRAKIPLLVAASRVVWVCGVQVSHDARVTPATRRVLHARFVNA